jgi:hypothetical protein
MPTRRVWALRPSAAALLAAALLAAADAATAQQGPQFDSGLPAPRLTVLTPSGGKAGTTVEVTAAGADTEEAEKLVFSHPGIKAELIPAPPPDPKQPPMKGQAPPSRFKVTIAADVPLGQHDARLVNKWGVSTARAFTVGDLNEVLEKEPNNDVSEAQRIELGTTVNGAISAPTDVDYYVFAGKKGQRVVVSCLASSVDSRATPGVEVFTAGGKLLASGRNYDERDALADVTLPDDGDYTVRVYEFTYTQGTPEHFYRLSVSTAPWIDAVHPCVVEPGKATQVTVWGRNLPNGQPDPTAVVDGRVLDKAVVTVNAPAADGRLAFAGHLRPAAAALDGGFELRLKNAAGSSNGYLLTFARAPVVLDNEAKPHNTPETAQAVPVPCEIAGRVEKKRDRDWYVFEAKKGDVYNIEVLSERAGAPTFMYFLLRNAATKANIVESPDNPEIVSAKFFARTEDPAVYRFAVPADGKYELLVASRVADTLAGPRHLYRVRITPDLPDFQLAVAPQAQYRPDGLTVRQGGNALLEVFAWRRDGFSGDVALTVEGLPPGVTCVPQSLGGPLRHALIVLQGADGAAAWTGEIKVKGTATIKGKQVVREARVGAITWPVQPQQNIPTIGRLEKSLWLAVRDQKAPVQVTATVDKAQIVQGDKGTITVKVARHWAEAKTPVLVYALTPGQQVPLPYLPPNLNVNNNQPVTVAPNADSGTLAVNVSPQTPPGTYNLVLFTQTQFPWNRDPNAKQKQPTNVVLPATPITLVVLPKTLAQVTVGTPNLMVKAGGQAELAVKVQRQHDFGGEFKVRVVLPQGAAGVEIADAVIPAGQDEVKLVVKAAADAAPGNRANLIVRATAMYNGTTPIVQDAAPFVVNVVK